jgi:hypothetical protein
VILSLQRPRIRKGRETRSADTYIRCDGGGETVCDGGGVDGCGEDGAEGTDGARETAGCANFFFGVEGEGGCVDGDAFHHADEQTSSGDETLRESHVEWVSSDRHEEWC